MRLQRRSSELRTKQSETGGTTGGGGAGGRLSSAETADGGQAARLKQGARWAATAAPRGRGAGRRGVACVSRRQGGRQQHGASMRALFRPGGRDEACPISTG